MLTTARWRLQWQGAGDEGLLAVQEVHSTGTLWVQLTNGCEMSLVWDQTYLEAWSRPKNEVNFQGSITDTHSAGVPGKHLLDIIGGTFLQPIPPRNPDGSRGPASIFYQFPDGRVEMVHQWKYDDTATFKLGLVNAGSARGIALIRPLKNKLLVEGDCVAPAEGKGWIRTTYGATRSETLQMPTPLYTLEHQWHSSYHSGDRRIKLQMIPGSYRRGR